MTMEKLEAMSGRVADEYIYSHPRATVREQEEASAMTDREETVDTLLERILAQEDSIEQLEHQNRDAEAKWDRMEREKNEKRTALRDQFAMAALTGMLSAYWVPMDKFDYKTEQAYKYADAMLEARDR